jgi:hypothetical protein
MIEVAALAVSTTVRAPTLAALRVAMVQFAPHTSLVMLEPLIVLPAV